MKTVVLAAALVAFGDYSLISVWNTAAMNVAHAFGKPGRFTVSCMGPFNTDVSWAKLTAVRVAQLSNGHSP